MRTLHPHFKHITHRRIGTKNRFTDSPTEKCRLCNRHQENSCHLAWCPATKKVFDAIDAIAGYTPSANRTRKQKAKDRLFAYPDVINPDSLKTLYIIAWKYIIRDFYRVEFESYEYHYIPVLESTLVRFTTLVRGLSTLNTHSQARTRKAAQGRKPKLKSPTELSAPTFTENDKGILRMNARLGLVAEAIGLAERLA